MNVTDVIITTGSWPESSSISLDTTLEHILKMEKNPIIVLNQNADEILRSCSYIESCDLVFDPNAETDFFSEIRAGLMASSGAAFVLPANIGIPKPAVWKALEQKMGTLTPDANIDVLYFSLVGDAPHLSIYPQLITLSGAKRLKQFQTAVPWEIGSKIVFHEVAWDDFH